MRFHCGRGCLIQCCKNRNQVINKIVLPQLQLVRTKAQVYMLESVHCLSQYTWIPQRTRCNCDIMHNRRKTWNRWWKHMKDHAEIT